MESQSNHHDQASAWNIISLLLNALMSDWGAPAALAARRFLLRSERKHILIFLIPLEALARRLIFILAAALPKAVIIERKARSRSLGGAHGRANLWSDVSAAWGVSFVMLARPSRKRRRARRAGPPKHSVDSRPLAERIEALSRVLADPAPYAKRLALSLHRRGRAAASALVLRPCRNGIRTNPVADHLRAANAHAAPLIVCFANTS